MKKNTLIIPTVLLGLLGIGFIATANAQAGSVGFAYGTGFQNIPLNRYAYVTHSANYSQPTAISPSPTTPQETIRVASAETRSEFPTVYDSRTSRKNTPKKELLPLTGPRLN